MTITIGIPFYNAEAYLAGAIRSVFAQTQGDWELLLVDDGSTDGSLEIARAVKDPRVRVISDGQNLKLAARLNQIASLARYDIIARMDADDLMPPDRIERQLEVLRDDPTVDLVSSGLLSMTEDCQPLGVRWHHSVSVSRSDLVRKNGCGIVHAAVLGRKAWFLRNPYDPTVPIAQDYELWLRTSRKDDLRVHVIPAPLYYCRESSSVTAAKLLRSYANDRRSIWRNMTGPGDLRFIAKAWLKTLVLSVVGRKGDLGWLIKRRNREITDASIVDRFTADIAVIRATRVPGL